MAALGFTGKKEKTFNASGSSERNWYSDRYQSVLVQRNILALVTFASLVAVLLSTVTIAQLTPLKSVQPFLITVDEKSGITQTVDPLKYKDLTGNQALVQYFAVKYIAARESYNQNIYQQNYQQVRLMSTPPIFFEYARIFNPRNESSPLVKFGKDLDRKVEFLSLSFLDDKNVQVRVRISNSPDIGRPPLEEKNYIILLSYVFAKLDLATKDRYINPLGFQVTSYRLDEDFVNK